MLWDFRVIERVRWLNDQASWMLIFQLSIVIWTCLLEPSSGGLGSVRSGEGLGCLTRVRARSSGAWRLQHLNFPAPQHNALDGDVLTYNEQAPGRVILKLHLAS